MKTEAEVLVEFLQSLSVQEQECRATIQMLQDEVAKKQNLLSRFDISRDKEKSMQAIEKITLYINCALREFSSTNSSETEKILAAIGQHNGFVEFAIVFGAGENDKYKSSLQAAKINFSVQDNNIKQDYLYALLVFLKEVNVIHAEVPLLTKEHAPVYQRLMLLFSVSRILLNNHCSIFLHAQKLDEIRLSLEGKISIEEEKLEMAQDNLGIIQENIIIVRAALFEVLKNFNWYATLNTIVETDGLQQLQELITRQYKSTFIPIKDSADFLVCVRNKNTW